MQQPEPARGSVQQLQGFLSNQLRISRGEPFRRCRRLGLGAGEDARAPSGTDRLYAIEVSLTFNSESPRRIPGTQTSAEEESIRLASLLSNPRFWGR